MIRQVFRGSFLIVLALGAFGCSDARPSTAGEAVGEISSPMGLTTEQDVVYDGWDIPATQCAVDGISMHCCQPGRAMIGIRQDSNVFKCAALASSGGTRSLSGLARNNMLSCPVGQVAVGFRADLNLLACQTLPDISLGVEIIDTPPGRQDAWPMHVCPADDLSRLGYTMTGLHLGENRMSCVPGFTRKPNQQQAEQIVWNQAYGMTWVVPKIDWVEGNRLNCGNGSGFIVDVGGVPVCSGGWTFTDFWMIKAVWLPGFTFHQSPLAHELAHAYLFVTTGTGDGGGAHQNNTGPIWGPGGKVDQATTLLRDAGL